MRSRPHNARHLDVVHSGTYTLAQYDGGAKGVPLLISCQISSSPSRIGDGDIQGRERCSSRAQNPNTGARARRTTRNRFLIFL